MVDHLKEHPRLLGAVLTVLLLLSHVESAAAEGWAW